MPVCRPATWTGMLELASPPPLPRAPKLLLPQQSTPPAVVSPQVVSPPAEIAENETAASERIGSPSPTRTVSRDGRKGRMAGARYGLTSKLFQNLPHMY